jgi:hypothetical protein
MNEFFEETIIVRAIGLYQIWAGRPGGLARDE